MEWRTKLLVLVIIAITMVTSIPVNTVVKPKRIMLNVSVGNIDFLQRFGYYQAPDPRIGALASEDNLMDSIKRLQRFAEIPETGVMDEQTKKLINTPRCGLPDFGPSDNAKRKRRFTLQGSTWKKFNLSWRLTNENNDGLTRGQVLATLRLAFGKWQAVTNLDFHEIDSGEADIMVKFVSGYHQDPYPFDGRGGTIAHAFYPHTNRGLSGDVHYDDDEYFTLGSPEGRNLLWVTVHELGHSLGLEHSNVHEAIMYPWYKGYQGDDFDLTYDDIAGIQNIYGSKRVPTTSGPDTQTPQTTVATDAPSTCLSVFKAIFYDRRSGESYVINDDKVYVLGKRLGIVKGPVELMTLFPGLDAADAVYVNKDEQIVFFKGSRYYIYDRVDDARLVEEGSIYDKFKGLSTDVTKIDAAFIWKKNGRMYLFAGDDYYRYDETRQRIDYGYPRKIRDAWKGVPDNVDAVFIWSNDVTYFFKGTQFYRMDDRTITVQSGYPRDTAISWSKCTGALVAESGNSPANSLRSSYMMVITLLPVVMTRLLL